MTMTMEEKDIRRLLLRIELCNYEVGLQDISDLITAYDKTFGSSFYVVGNFGEQVRTMYNDLYEKYPKIDKKIIRLKYDREN